MISRKERKELKAFAKIIASGDLDNLLEVQRFDVSIHMEGGHCWTIDRLSRRGLDSLYKCMRSKKIGTLEVSGGRQTSEGLIDWSKVVVIYSVPSEEEM